MSNVELPQGDGYVLVTRNGAMVCQSILENHLYLTPYPLIGDAIHPFLLCEYLSGARAYAKEWNAQYPDNRVKPVKVTVKIEQCKSGFREVK